LFISSEKRERAKKEKNIGEKKEAILEKGNRRKSLFLTLFQIKWKTFTAFNRKILCRRKGNTLNTFEKRKMIPGGNCLLLLTDREKRKNASCSEKGETGVKKRKGSLGSLLRVVKKGEIVFWKLGEGRGP